MENKTFWQAVKFTLFSISAGVIQTLTFSLIELFVSDNYWIAYLPSLVLSILWNFTLNRKYTFKATSNVPVAMLKVFCFYLAFTPISTWLGHLAEGAGAHDFLIFAVTILSNFVLEFLFYKFVVYREKK